MVFVAFGKMLAWGYLHGIFVGIFHGIWDHGISVGTQTWLGNPTSSASVADDQRKRMRIFTNKTTNWLQTDGELDSWWVAINGYTMVYIYNSYIIMYHINMIIYSYIGIYWEFMGFNGNPYYIILYILTKRQGFKKCHDQGWFLCCCPNMWNSLLSQWYTLWQSNMACWKMENSWKFPIYAWCSQLETSIHSGFSTINTPSQRDLHVRSYSDWEFRPLLCGAPWSSKCVPAREKRTPNKLTQQCSKPEM